MPEPYPSNLIFYMSYPQTDPAPPTSAKRDLHLCAAVSVLPPYNLENVMRWTGLCVGLLLAGCTEIAPSGDAPAAGNATNGAQQAYFTGYPNSLFFAAAAVCDGPGQSVVKPTVNEVRCESLPDPESAAAIILQFNGTVEALPKFVISFAGRNTPQGYLVTADNYIRVPQRDGGAQQVRFPNTRITEELESLLRAAGGRPL